MITPGPWHYSAKQKTIWRGDVSEEGGNLNYVRIAQWIHNPDDARLILAAADLLEVADLLIEGIKTPGPLMGIALNKAIMATQKARNSKIEANDA